MTTIELLITVKSNSVDHPFSRSCRIFSVQCSLDFCRGFRHRGTIGGFAARGSSPLTPRGRRSGPVDDPGPELQRLVPLGGSPVPFVEAIAGTNIVRAAGAAARRPGPTGITALVKAAGSRVHLHHGRAAFDGLRRPSCQIRRRRSLDVSRGDGWPDVAVQFRGSMSLARRTHWS